ncbi:MAG: hypothetical protein ACI4OJ_05475 [Lachnospiraceae bacterium]
MGVPSTKDRIRSALPAVCTVVMMAGMALVAERSGQREILFPEIAALSFGYLLAPSRAWVVNKKRMLLLMSCCAVVGYLYSVYLPLPYWGRIALAFATTQVVFLYSGTSLAPLVSAIVLPVVLRTDSLVYPIAAFVLTLCVILLRSLLEKMGIRNRESYVPLPLPSAGAIAMALIRTVMIIFLAFFCVRIGILYVIAPPLLVFFTEVTSARDSRAVHTPVSTVLFLTLCALSGASARQLLAVHFHLPLALAALAGSLLCLLIVYIFGMYVPPAGALCMLAFLIPAESILTYPLQVLTGAALFMLTARIRSAFAARAGRKRALTRR